MTNRMFVRQTPKGQTVEFNAVNPIHVSAFRRDTEDHAFHIETTDRRLQLVLVRIDALAARDIPSGRPTPSGEEIAVRHILRCIDDGTLPRDGSQATEVIYDVSPLLD